MRDEVVALEDEADAVVAVGIPIGIFVLAGGNAIDHDVTGIGVVQTAQDIEQGSLAGTAGAQHRNEFAVAECKRHAIEGGLLEVRNLIRLADVLEFDHRLIPSRKHVFPL